MTWPQAKMIQFTINIILFYILFSTIFNLQRFNIKISLPPYLKTFAKKVLCQKICEFFSSRKLFPHHFLPLKVFRNTWKNWGRSHWQKFWIAQALEKFIIYASLNLEKNLKTAKESIFKKIVGIPWIDSHELCKDFSKL